MSCKRQTPSYHSPPQQAWAAFEGTAQQEAAGEKTKAPGETRQWLSECARVSSASRSLLTLTPALSPHQLWESFAQQVGAMSVSLCSLPAPRPSPYEEMSTSGKPGIGQMSQRKGELALPLSPLHVGFGSRQYYKSGQKCAGQEVILRSPSPCCRLTSAQSPLSDLQVQPQVRQ